MAGYRILVPTSRAVAAPVWRLLRAAAAPLSIGQLHVATGAHPNAIQLRLKRWERAGLVSVASQQPRTYSMSDRDPQPPRMSAAGALTRKPTARQRMWSAMRVLKRFDLPSLMMTSEQSRRSCETYINSLARGGYLRTLERGNSTKGTWSTYHLVRRSGLHAPIVQHQRGSSARMLFDPNTGQRIDISPGVISLQACIKRAPRDRGVS